MLTAFDVAIGVLVLISAILATARGLTREVLSLVTWAGSAAIAVWMWQYHPEIARGFIREEIVADIATVVVSFIVSLIVLHLITMRIADFVVESKIGPLDRTLGFVFGALRGILIGVIIVVFGQWLNWGGFSDYVDGSRTVPPLASVGDGLIRMLPDNLEEAVTGFLEGDETAPAGEDQATEEGTDAGETGLKT